MIRAYLFALDPTDAQIEAMGSHCGAARFVYNWCLGQVRANWDQRRAEESYGIPADERTPWINTSAYSLRKAWNAAKQEVAPWWAENSKEAYATGCANLSTALANRKAGRARMPRFKSKHRSRPSCRFTTGTFGFVRDRRHVQLPVIGVVRTAESTRKLARHIEAGTARIRSLTLSFQRGRWHVAFSVELPDREADPRTGARVVGVDLGISTLATLSSGEKIPNGRRLDRELVRLRRAQRTCARRRGPDRRTRVGPSNRWHEARARADRIHTRVANLRRNDTHHLTTRLVRDHDLIVIEDLHVAGMLRNRRLARHISGAAWAEIRRQLTYKTERAGVRLVVADRWFASSKTCSGCGTAKAKLMLSERTFVCAACGLVLDRDHNAARNLAALGAADTGELNPRAARRNRCQTSAACCGRNRIATGRVHPDSTPSPRGGDYRLTYSREFTCNGHSGAGRRRRCKGVRWAGVLLVIVAFAALLWAHRAELPATGHALRGADRGWLVIGVAAVVLCWLDWVLLHVICRRLMGVGGVSEITPLAPVTVAALALNLAVKSGGMAGLAVFLADGRRRSLETTRVSGAYLMAATLVDIAFVIALSAGIAVVWVDGRITRPEIVAVVIFGVMLVVKVMALYAAVRSRELLRRWWSLPARALDRVLRRPAREHDTTGADELYEAIGLLRRRPVAVLPAVGLAVAVDLLGVVMLWAALAAVGGGDRPVLALVAYAISTLFGILGLLPGGLGFVEFGAVAVLVSFGTPVGVAAAAVVVFRVLQFWLPVAVGLAVSWWLGRRTGGRRVAQVPA